MELTINVDESMFKNVIEKELNAFPKEELHEIVRECIISALRETDMVKKLFVAKQHNPLYSYRSEEPTELLKQAARTINLSPAFEELQQSMVDTLKNNHRELLEKAMLQMLLEGIAYSSGFQNAMRDSIQSVLSERMKENG